MTSKPLVSIVILNWNGEALLEECLLSIRETLYRPFEVVVVDNASTDGSLELLERFPEVRAVVNDKNYGYAEGNNRGIAHCSGKYIVTLNNDITVDPAWLNAPVAALEADPSIGLVGCRQMSYYQHDRIDGLYHTVKKDLTFQAFGAQQELSSDPVFLQDGYTLTVNGGSSMVRKSMLDAIGGYDTRFFAYYDEVDLCFKAFVNGWRAWYSSAAVVYHKGSVSFKKVGVFTYYLRERNRLWFMFKYLPWSLILKRSIPLVAMELRVVFVMCIKLRRPDQYIKARLDALFGCAAYRTLRKENVKRLKLRYREFMHLLRCSIIYRAQ